MTRLERALLKNQSLLLGRISGHRPLLETVPKVYRSEEKFTRICLENLLKSLINLSKIINSQHDIKLGQVMREELYKNLLGEPPEVTDKPIKNVLIIHKTLN